MLVDTNLVGLGPYLVWNQVNRSGTMPKMIYHVTSSMSATCHGQRGRDSDLPHQFLTNEVTRDHVGLDRRDQTDVIMCYLINPELMM